MEFFTAFGVDWFKLGAQIVNFLVILYLLNRFAFKPLLVRMDERAARISKGLEDAEAAERDRALASAEREAAVAEGRKEAQAMIARATKIAEDSRAEIVTAACMANDHLWQDLGLWSRKYLSQLMTQNFPALAAKNNKDMKWKKFLYKQLCAQEGIYVCRAPSCEVCVDYAKCFGPEE